MPSVCTPQAQLKGGGKKDISTKGSQLTACRFADACNKIRPAECARVDIAYRCTAGHLHKESLLLPAAIMAPTD